MPQYTVHATRGTSSTYPDAFWPERFGNDDSSPPAPRRRAHAVRAQFVHEDAAYIPFGHGQVHCVGKGVLEMRMLTCALVHKFDFEVPQGACPE
ncbi:hypothetical protein K466DRAFT_579848 [Polyporus arcularius HHB13444]|uniref:Cytochrome P450 n=1 Tax=Polyporus arcularius HHB13444 TaxID=1314778 RepID=A0A5C3PXN6_9APHY|nr:hypothetical protein K466DRAFT_579848 [Polyporus arcularius HHB13444]